MRLTAPIRSPIMQTIFWRFSIILQIDQAALVGLSVGGMIAQRIAVDVPRRVRALVLCDTAAKIGTRGTLGRADRRGRRAAASRPSPTASCSAGSRRRFARRNRMSGRAGATCCVRTPAHGYVGTCAALRDADLTDDAARISVPTLCLVGDQDGSTPPDLVRQTADLIPGARFEIIAEAGHIPCIERPDETARLIEQHLQEAGYV